LGFNPDLASPEEKYAVKYTIPALGEHISIFGNEGIASCSLPIYLSFHHHIYQKKKMNFLLALPYFWTFQIQT
jgi:hypothetical protein